MPRWKTRLEIEDLWSAYEDDQLSVDIFGKQIAERILKLPFVGKERIELEEIAQQFSEIDPMESIEEQQEWFNQALTDLYDFGDVGNRLWVNRF